MRVIIDGIIYTPEQPEALPGGKCPSCGNTYQNYTTDSRCNEDTGMRTRKRRCAICGAKWKTAEVII